MLAGRTVWVMMGNTCSQSLAYLLYPLIPPNTPSPTQTLSHTHLLSHTPIQAASAVMNTHISSCTAGMVWFMGSYIRTRRWAVTEIISGVLAGLAAITPGSGDMTSRSAFFVGLSAGLASLLWCIHAKAWDQL